MAAWIFLGAMVLVGHAYGGYLAVLVLLDALTQLGGNARFLAGTAERRAGDAPAVLPKVSVLIAAHDEASCITAKIENTLALDYPADKLEILIGSDGSTDGTDELVRAWEARGVRLSAARRGGKVAVLNRLATLATGEAWLFTDANTVLERGALKALVRRLQDPDVGGACGRLRLVTPDGGERAEGLYWRYENLLKFYESKRGALMGANGGLYLLRREEWRPLASDTIVDDFVVTMRVVQANHRLIYAPDAVAEEETAPDLAGEFKRRVRISAGNFQSLRELAPLLLRADFPAFAFWSHKLLRWLAPVLLVTALAANVVLAVDSGAWQLVLAGHVAPYLLAALARTGWLGPLDRFACLSRYFVEMNAAVFLGLVRHLRRSQGATWQRTARTPIRRAA